MIFYSLVLIALTPLPGSAKPQPHQPDALCLYPSRLYPDLNDCGKFIRCVNKKPVTFSCPPRTIFDPETQVCTWRSDSNDCHSEEVVVPSTVRSVVSDSKSKPVVGKVLDKSVVSDISGPSRYASIKYRNTIPDVQETLNVVKNIGKSTDTEIGDNSFDYDSNIPNSAANRKMRPTGSNLAKAGNREHHNDLEKASLDLSEVIFHSQATPTAQTNLRQKVMESTTFSSSLDESNDSSMQYNIHGSETRPTEQQTVLRFLYQTTEAIQSPDVSMAPDSNTDQTEITFLSTLAKSNEPIAPDSNTAQIDTSPDSVAKSNNPMTTDSNTAQIDATFFGTLAKSNDPMATNSDTAQTDPTFLSTLAKSNDPSRHMYTPHSLRRRDQHEIFNPQETQRTNVVASPHPDVSNDTFSNYTITDTTDSPKPREIELTFYVQNTSSINSTSNTIINATNTSSINSTSTTIINPTNTNNINSTSSNNINPTNTSEPKKVEKINGVDSFNVNTSLAEHPTEHGKALTSHETSISPKEDINRMIYLTTLPEVRAPTPEATYSYAETDSSRDNFSFYAQLTTPLFKNPSNIDTITNVSNNNEQDQSEDNRTPIQGSDQLHTNPTQTVHQENPTQQPIMDAINSSDAPVFHQEIAQPKYSYKHHTNLQSNSLDDKTNEMIFPENFPTENKNTDSTATTVPSDNFPFSHGSTHSFIEATPSVDTPMASEIDSDGQFLYGLTPSSVELNNILIATGDSGVTPPPYHVEAESSSHDYFETIVFNERPLISPYMALDLFSEDKNNLSVMPKGQNPTSDPTTLPASSSPDKLAHTQQDEGVAQMYDATTPPPTWTPERTEKVLNFSFKSVPYMIKGLVRPFRCPEPDGHFVDPKNCSVFYHCAGGQAYRRDCPSDQVFHLGALSCVSTSQAPPCPTTDDLLEEHTIAEDKFQCPSDGHFRDPDQCNVYYVCVSGNSMRMTCDPGTSFDANLNLCLWHSDVVDCSDNKVISHDQERKINHAFMEAKKDLLKIQPPRDLYFNQEEYICPKPHGVFPDPNNCSVYHMCDGGVARRKVCRRGTGFDLVDGMCVESWRLIRCAIGSSYEEKPIATAPPRQSTSFNCPEAHGLYPDPDNCSSFIHCFKKVPYRHKCQHDTVFNSETGVCTWRELVPECQLLRNNADSMAPTTPNSAGASLSMSWNDDVQMVPYKQLEPNTESPLSVAQPRPVIIQDFTCPEVADGFFRDNLFCDIFHRCVFRTRFTFTCPTGTFFRLRGNMCDFWETVIDCTKDGLRIDAMRGLPEYTQLPLTSPAPNDHEISNSILDSDPTPCPENSGLFPHPRNCRQFLFCAYSVPLVLTCPETLLYNPQTLTCDLSKNVRCLRYDDYAKK